MAIETQALAMISFISNRMVAGASPRIREFADISVNEARIILFIQAGLVSTAAEAMRLIGIDQAAVSRCVKRLIERGFVLSTPDTQHAKRIILALTDAGNAYAKAIWHLNREREDRLLSVLSAAERAFFLDMLARVLGNVDDANTIDVDSAWLND
jgi:DNA-binding MarR family transcriptional regulator